MKQSAALLLFRRAPELEVLLGHMGGPFWRSKDERAWSIPKGEYGPDEEPRAAAFREFAEELGSPVPDGPEYDLGTVRQSSAKLLTVFAREADFDPETVHSNTFELEWPPRSGRRETFPEIDRAGWFSLEKARSKVVVGQVAVFDRLADALS